MLLVLPFKAASATAGTTQPVPYNFKGDNAVGVLPSVVRAIAAANEAPAAVEWGGYGMDPATAELHRVAARHERCPRRRAQRLVVVPVEHEAARSEAGERGCAHFAARAHEGHVRHAQVVGDDPHEVRRGHRGAVESGARAR